MLFLVSALPLLSPVFGSHMVLQRDRPNTFWGWTSPGTRVTLSIGHEMKSGVADQTGKWTVRITPPPAGGPYTVDVDADRKVRLDDVLVGDVWLCSGQSNMEFGMGMVKNAQAEIQAANYPGIRLFMVSRATALTPQPVAQGTWKTCTPETIRQDGWDGFSAVGYFFGRELHRDLKVPIGLVESSWGGTPAEAWASPEGLAPLKDFDPSLEAIRQQLIPGAMPFHDRLGSWFSAHDPGSKNSWEADTLDDHDWAEAQLPASFNDLHLSDQTAVVWFRRHFDVPAGAENAWLTLGSNRDFTAVWVNGQKVGEAYSLGIYQQYKLPAGALRTGDNTIAIRMVGTQPGGGFTNGPEQLDLRFGSAVVPLAGTWKFRMSTELAKVPAPPLAVEGNPYFPTVLFNGMISPLAPMALKGAIWYQGETNVGRAKQYQKLLPAMITDWRNAWGEGAFPFYIVQLANFATRHNEPAEDPWPELREAQAIAAKAVKNSGLAVTIDIGQGEDIHPKNKQDVGFRLAQLALHDAYHQNVPYSGPVVRRVERRGNEIRVDFDHCDGGLVSKGPLVGFQISGADHKFVWATARIEGRSVLVSAPGIDSPEEVRYAWDANPEAPLYNGAGFSAVPFRASVGK
jgi:sialate O-acetylesterase